jgi:hypothetical protein
MNTNLKKAIGTAYDFANRHRLFIFGLTSGFGYGLMFAFIIYKHGWYLFTLGILLVIFGNALYRSRNDLK